MLQQLGMWKCVAAFCSDCLAVCCSVLFGKNPAKYLEGKESSSIDIAASAPLELLVPFTPLPTPSTGAIPCGAAAPEPPFGTVNILVLGRGGWGGARVGERETERTYMCERVSVWVSMWGVCVRERVCVCICVCVCV